MTTNSAVNVKVYRNGTILKNITEPIRLDGKDWTEYAKSLKTIQKNVNVYLSELVEREKTAGDHTNMEEEHEDESDEEDDSPKRKLESIHSDKGCKKTKT